MSELDALKLLRRIDEGVAGKTGEAFFQQVVCELSHALDAHGAFTSRLLPNRRARMLAFWVGGAYETCLEYELAGTPCEFVYRGQITAYARNVGDVFPVDRAWFEHLGVHSYLGIPVKDEAGTVCGHLAVMDTRERDWAEADIDVLRLFSLRAAAEINRMRYQRELEEAKAVAESANHAKSVFMSQMSHELRTPLNGILGFAQLLRREGGVSAEKMRDGLGIIERSGEHLLEIVNDLLDLARIESGKLELSFGPVDLREVLEHVADLARVRARNAGLTFTVAVEIDTFAAVMADERVIRQVLLNLLGNAVKFTERGGRVTLRAARSTTAENRQLVRFVVEDTGIGIEESELSRIFEPFHRVGTPDRTIEGTGLGLTITQRLVAALNGRISVASQKGRGSTFTVECELDCAPLPQVLAHPAGEIEGYAGETRIVLVVDDDGDNRVLLTGLLESAGFLVQTAGNGREAFDRLRAIRPDLILTDLVMPVLDGPQLVQALRADTALGGIPMVAMSASASVYSREKAFEAGCCAFLPKPLRLASVLETIGNELQLQWRYRSDAKPALARDAASAARQPFRLDSELAAQLQDLAMLGDVVALTALIDSTLARDSSADLFCDEVRALAARYDIRGIRQVIAASCCDPERHPG